MEDSSASSDDGSVIICIDPETDEFLYTNENEQEMHITSSDIITQNNDKSVEDKMPTEPDSSSKMPELPSDPQGHTTEISKDDKTEVTLSDSNSRSLLDSMDKLQTNPDSSLNKKEISLTTYHEEDEVQFMEERSMEKITAETNSVSSTTVENASTEKASEEKSGEEVVVIEEIVHEKEKSLHIPTKILQNLIARAIMSSPEGYLSIESIVKFLAKRGPCSERKIEFLRKITINTLENNGDVFLPHIVKNESSFESGFWTLKPIAAAKFVYNDILEKKHKKCPFQKKSSTAVTSIVDERLNKRSSVPLKRSSTLDFWASKIKFAKMETTTLVIPSSDVENKLRNYGISFETKWEGWKSLDLVLENKISKLERIIENYSNPDTSDCFKYRGKEHGAVEQSNVTTVSSVPETLLRRKGVKRARLSDSCSELESSDSELPARESIIHNEHNYVASKDSSGSMNLIENLRKIVQKMDKDCDKKYVNNKPFLEKKASGRDSQHEKEDFLGFDYDFPSGFWRGWEKVSSRNLERLREILRNERGSNDLEEVLRDSEVAVIRCLENLERSNIHNEEKVHNTKTCDLDLTVNEYLKELMAVYGDAEGEPPVSFLVLIVMATCASPEPAVTVEEICQFILQHFPFHGRQGRPRLESLVEATLRLGSPTTFTCQRSRRPSNPATCWRIDSTLACGILSRALQNHKIKNGKPGSQRALKNPTNDQQISRSPQNKKPTEEYRVETPNPQKQNRIKSQPGVIVNVNSINVLGKTCHENPKTQLNGEVRQSIKENMATDSKIIADASIKSRLTLNSPVESGRNDTVKDINNSALMSSVSVILSADSSKESIKIKQSFTAPHSPKNMESAENMYVIKSPCNSPLNLKEDEELDIVDIDPYLQNKENSNLDSEDDEVIIIDDNAEPILGNLNHGNERIFGNEQSSIINEVTNEACDRTPNCSFLLRCYNLDADSKQYPCYICHKFYVSNEAVRIHFAQTHFEKENIHITSTLCQSQKIKPKSIMGTKKMVLISPEKTFRSEVIGSRPSMESLLIDLQSKPSDGVIRYNCSKCNAIFHEQETLDLHISVYHEDSLRSLIPFKQAITREGNKLYYYCTKCSGCFDTEKALDVHKCVPFSHAPPSFP